MFVVESVSMFVVESVSRPQSDWEFLSLLLTVTHLLRRHPQT